MNVTLKNNRILIVDDEPKNLKLLQVRLKRVRLKSTGYDVSTAEDGLEGYEKAQNVKPAVIVKWGQTFINWHWQAMRNR